ncbi:MAG TPA: TraB/GumN family protein [Luteimonas sp.]|nr:TraB/GumN family protein [Luteimonas sp.]
MSLKVMPLKVMLLSCATAVVIATAAHASTPPKASASAPVPLLWKVSDADNAVYLLGSFHLLKPGDYPLSRDVDAAFADAESLVFEISPEEMASPTLPMQMGQAALRSDGTQLDSELPPATAAKLHAWLAANDADVQASGLPPQLLQNFEPWFVGLTISLIEMTRDGLDPKLGLDQHFAAAAKTAGKPTAGLETGAQQIAFLDGMDKDEQLQFLDETLEETGPGKRELEKLHSAWRAGDVATLWNGMAADMQRQYPKLYRHINIERNDAWLPKIEQRLRAPGRDDTLVVVGALHLLGSDGVVEKLRAKGYRVERICSACAVTATK